MDDKEIDICFKLAVTLAKEAGQMIAEIFSEEKSYDLKSNHADMCTETDLRVEKFVFDSIKEQFPDHCFIGEESESAGVGAMFTDAPTWIIDPIDGTTNFVHGYEYVCISIGLWVKKKPICGVIYNPIKKELYTARLGEGAFCNGKRLHVSPVLELRKSLITTECHLYPTMEQVDQKLANVRVIVANSHGIRGTGSSALSMTLVASGCYDGHFEYGLHCWDMAAGALLVTEAGGVVIDTSGGEFDLMSRRLIAACSEEVAREISALITNIYFKRDCE